ncbi:cytochrome o ubiquinol oxidase subunit III [Candidatus Profftia sp. (ex Adelges kitamiensis)]|uniref:cytochrome o ubiquinol oxidase subunit III n=1 Tax=Candidatus Profftia sp. (ex Adelges kitamiensis) TaxID=2864218 RepID=UPI001CE248D8|nr:cytochrome o ubiquinol oxidase subunit III [Candidatus Profftia sp. (ex Adelges kitamiensis)]
MINNTLNNQEYNNYYVEYSYDKTNIFGFMLYLMSDCILFAILCATYAVLVHGTADGPSGKEIFKPLFVLGETLILLFSSLTYGFAMLASKKNKIYVLNSWLVLTFLLGVIFIAMENYELHHLISKGFGPDKSAFLSAFFALISTHGIHVTSGLIWIIIMIIQLIKNGLNIHNRTRLMCLSLFWHLLDVIWICLFTLIYLIGVV